MRAMLGEMTSSEFAEWCAFFALEPWGFDQENRRTALVASTVANTAGKTLKRLLPLSAFMPRARDDGASPAEVRARFAAMRAARNGR